MEAQVRPELLIGGSDRGVEASRDRAKEQDSMGRGLQKVASLAMKEQAES